jgi:hypothetical protein
MKKSILFYFLALSLNAYAVDPTTLSSTASNAEVTTNAEAGNSNNAQNINFNTTPLATTTVRTTGSAHLGGFSGSFSTDYCGATAQAGLGGIGFGISGGMPKIDNACVMLRTFERTQQAASAIAQIDPIGSEKLRRASLAILAEIDPKIKVIFEKAGLIGPNGIGIIGKLSDENAKVKVGSAEAKISGEVMASSEVKPRSDPQVDSVPVSSTPSISTDSSSDKPKTKWFYFF